MLILITHFKDTFLTSEFLLFAYLTKELTWIDTSTRGSSVDVVEKHNQGLGEWSRITDTDFYGGLQAQGCDYTFIIIKV